MATAEVVIAPVLCGPVGLYAQLWRAGGRYRMDWDLPFDKRYKESHRFEIADVRGRTVLTVPIAKPESRRCVWGDIMVSAHDEWWDKHRIALESAYGRTPYFEFLIDRFMSMLRGTVMETHPRLRDLAEAWDAGIRSVLEMWGEPTPVSDEACGDVRYWQLREPELGFIGGLSVLDLIFNMGPEAGGVLVKG